MKEQDLKNAVNNIKISESTKMNILKKTKQYRKEEKNMKLKNKFISIAIAATFVLSTTIFAASGIIKSWSSSSSAFSDYKSLPSTEQVMKDIGYKAVLIDSFANGYVFKDGNIVKNTLSDENGNSMEKFKSISFRYEKDNDVVYFSQDKFNSETEKEGEVIATENDTDIYYYSYINKVVPPDYKLTDEDKKAEENGELVFSYGSSKIEISKVQSVTWERDNMKYCLMQIDGKLSEDELCNMAKEAICLF